MVGHGRKLQQNNSGGCIRVTTPQICISGKPPLSHIMAVKKLCQDIFAQSSSFSKTKNVPGYTLFYYSGLTRWIRLRRRMRGRRDSNSQPQDRQSCALTNWATPPMPVTGLAPVTLGLWCPCSTIELHRPKFVAPVGVEPTAPAYETGEITVSPRRVVLLYYKKSGKSTP